MAPSITVMHSAVAVAFLTALMSFWSRLMPPSTTRTTMARCRAGEVMGIADGDDATAQRALAHVGMVLVGQEGGDDRATRRASGGSRCLRTRP